MHILILVSLPPALQSFFFSSRLCWFTMVTCTLDISWHTAVALPQRTAPRPSVLSGSGYLTTLYEKPACKRFCRLMLTCSSMKEYEDWTSMCSQRSSWNIDIEARRVDCGGHLAKWITAMCRTLLCSVKSNDSSIGDAQPQSSWTYRISWTSLFM